MCHSNEVSSEITYMYYKSSKTSHTLLGVYFVAYLNIEHFSLKFVWKWKVITTIQKTFLSFGCSNNAATDTFVLL